MKIIFLDIDGVLNTSETFKEIYYEFKETGKRRVEIDLKRVEYLKRIVDATDAKIVLSSTWRFFFNKEDDKLIPRNKSAIDLVEILNNYELAIYDITPRDSKGMRCNEINAWLYDKDVESFVIIDDDSFDLQEFVDKELIKTSFTKPDEMIKNMDDCMGLCEEHIPKCINILNKNVKKRTR